MLVTALHNVQVAVELLVTLNIFIQWCYYKYNNIAPFWLFMCFINILLGILQAAS